MATGRRAATLLTVVALAVAGGAGGARPFAADPAEPAFLQEPQALPEIKGTPADRAARDRAMGALQTALAARRVDQALRQEVVLTLSAAERKSIDEPGSSDGKYRVGVNKSIGRTVDFSPAEGLGERTRPLAAGVARGDGQGGFVWTAAVRAPGATAMRVRITGLDLPEGAELYVYNLAGQAFGPYTGRGPLGTGELFTHTVFGDRLVLQLQQPAGAARISPLRLEEAGVLGQRFAAPRYSPVGAFGANNPEPLPQASNLCSYNANCIVNAACTSSSAVNNAKEAVASILFASGAFQYICTGGLIADTNASTVIPYFLTAHHCISSSGEAASLETYFDYTTGCGSPNCTQPYGSAGDTVGSTIMATGSSSDYSLLRLASTPDTSNGVEAYLGWLTTAVANTNNLALFRISHPQGAPQAYSAHRVDTTKGTCRTLPRGSFIYSTDTLGATEGGSSGSPVVNAAGQIVGQLYGACGFNVNDSCDSAANATVDGAFAASYPSLAAFLNPGSGGSCSAIGLSCTSNSQCCSNKCTGKPGGKTCK
jgi:V8-like Glu-specific endopeptidase